MKQFVIIFIITLSTGCMSTQVKQSRDAFVYAQELLAQGEALSDEQEQVARASFMQAKQLASEIIQKHPDAAVAYQIFLESLFGLAQLDPWREEWYSFQALQVAMYAQKTFIDERFTHLFCYYLAKSFVGTRMTSEPMKLQLNACVDRALSSRKFAREYPKHREHLAILYQYIE